MIFSSSKCAVCTRACFEQFFPNEQFSNIRAYLTCFERSKKRTEKTVTLGPLGMYIYIYISYVYHIIYIYIICVSYYIYTVPTACISYVTCMHIICSWAVNCFSQSPDKLRFVPAGNRKSGMRYWALKGNLRNLFAHNTFGIEREVHTLPAGLAPSPSCTWCPLGRWTQSRTDSRTSLQDGFTVVGEWGEIGNCGNLATVGIWGYVVCRQRNLLLAVVFT